MASRSSSNCAAQGSAREYSSTEHTSTETQSPQPKTNGNLSTHFPPSATSVSTPSSTTTFYLSKGVGIPEDFDYSSENFNSDIDELYPEHRNSTKNTFKCKARIAHIASAIDNFDATMRRHGTA